MSFAMDLARIIPAELLCYFFKVSQKPQLWGRREGKGREAGLCLHLQHTLFCCCCVFLNCMISIWNSTQRTDYSLLFSIQTLSRPSSRLRSFSVAQKSQVYRVIWRRSRIKLRRVSRASDAERSILVESLTKQDNSWGLVSALKSWYLVSFIISRTLSFFHITTHRDFQRIKELGFHFRRGNYLRFSMTIVLCLVHKQIWPTGAVPAAKSLSKAWGCAKQWN